MPGHAAALAATMKKSHHHRRPMTIDNRQKQLHYPHEIGGPATRHTRRVTRDLRTASEAARVVLRSGVGRFLGVREITTSAQAYTTPARGCICSVSWG
jgi:hypothetical protein